VGVSDHVSPRRRRAVEARPPTCSAAGCRPMRGMLPTGATSSWARFIAWSDA
jgi:hypothetical protein